MKLFKTCTLGVALGTLALTGLAQAQDGMTGTMAPPPPPAPAMAAPDPAMAPPMAAPMMASSTPMPVSGTVLRYYVDRAGFVSAMDVQTADGVSMVRFSPSMAQTLTTMYPVGATANVYVTSAMKGGMMSYYLAGTGPAMPTATSMMMPMTVTDLDVLKSEPYIMLGSKQMTMGGKLDGYISDPITGEVLAIVLKTGDMKSLVRVPRENRLLPSSPSATGIAPLLAGSAVYVVGYPEAPRYGVVTPYDKRVVATGITVDGSTLGPLGFGKAPMAKQKALLGLNINLPILGGKAPKEVMATDSGYTTYEVPAPVVAPAPAPAPM